MGRWRAREDMRQYFQLQEASMLKALLAVAAVTLAFAASPALARTTIMPSESGPIPMRPTVQEVVPSQPVTPAERAQARRDGNEMVLEWQQRERTGIVPPQGSVGAPSTPVMGPSTYGGYGTETRIAPSRPPGEPMGSQMPMRSGLLGLPQEPLTPAERAQVRRDWNEMAREWEQRQRRGYVPPADIGQPFPYQR
jgi:hypothetical protein